MGTASRSQRVDRARLDAHLDVQQLWLRYISLSGIADLLEVDAYLHGLFTLDSYQEDKLSFAVNAELDELHQAARLPYTLPMEPTPAPENPLDILRELLRADRSHLATTHGDHHEDS
jgi:hypothetical protein